MAENKQLISISFAALVQTLQNDPEMIKAIYNISIANNDKDNKNNNIANYFKANKDRILNLGETNYEDLVKALANNAIATVISSSSDPKLSLPSSVLGSYNQSDTYRIEEPESYHHNSKHDIAD